MTYVTTSGACSAMRRACAAAPSAWMSASSLSRRPSSNERRPPEAARSSRLTSEGTECLGKRRQRRNRADRDELAAVGGKTALRRNVQRKVQLTVIGLIESRVPWYRLVRERDNLAAMRTRPGVRVREGVHALAHRGEVTFVNLAPRRPNGKDRLLRRPLVPEPSQIVDATGWKALDRIDRRVADQQRRLSGDRSIERLRLIHIGRPYAITPLENHP